MSVYLCQFFYVSISMSVLLHHFYYILLFIFQDLFFVSFPAFFILLKPQGRVKQLIEQDHMSISSINLFVLDEADKLLHQNFQSDVKFVQLFNLY